MDIPQTTRRNTRTNGKPKLTTTRDFAWRIYRDEQLNVTVNIAYPDEPLHYWREFGQPVPFRLYSKGTLIYTGHYWGSTRSMRHPLEWLSADCDQIYYPANGLTGPWYELK